MKINWKLLLGRSFYWIGAVLDARAGVRLVTTRYLQQSNFLDFSDPVQLKLLSEVGTAAALMWGWTLLLLWADRKPIERRGVLLLTVFPVVFGLILNSVSMPSFAGVGIQSSVGLILLGALLVFLPLACFLLLRSLEKSAQKDEKSLPIETQISKTIIHVDEE